MDSILHYLLLVRLCAISGLVFGLAIMNTAFLVTVPWIPVLSILAALGALTFAAWRVANRRGKLTQRGYMWQLSADVVALTGIVYFTGSAFNPLISLFLLPIAFSAAALPMFGTLFLAGLAVLCYTCLMFVPVAHQHSVEGMVNLHIWGMWYGFLLTAFCMALFVAGLARDARRRDAELSVLREQALEAERHAALGTLAAGTAHEMGTPLATISVVAGELGESVLDPDARRQISKLMEQVKRCKSILQAMASDAGALRAESGAAMPLDIYLDEIIDRWRANYPAFALSYHRSGSDPVPELVADRGITQAITHIMDNAAHAAQTTVCVVCEWSADVLKVSVRDDGHGIPQEIAGRLGREAVSTKEGGLGIGVLLSKSNLERLGGSLDLFDREQQGTVAVIHLPLRALKVS